MGPHSRAINSPSSIVDSPWKLVYRICRNDSVRNAHRVSGDHVWSLCVVRRRARPHGLLDVRHGAISVAAIGREVNDSADAVASPIERTRIRVLTGARRAVSMPAMQLSLTP